MSRLCWVVWTAGAALFAQTTESVQDTAARFCQGCHNDKLKTAGFSLDLARGAPVASHVGIWEKALHKVRTGEMPPPGLPKPQGAARTAFLAALENELDRAAKAQPN